MNFLMMVTLYHINIGVGSGNVTFEHGDPVPHVPCAGRDQLWREGI